MKKVFFVPIIFLASLIVSVAILFFVKFKLQGCSNLFFPTDLEKLKLLCEDALRCFDSYKFEIHLFHCVCFIFLQTWCIPGTVFFNLFGGAVFGIYKGTLICLILNTIGANLSFMLSKYFLGDFLDSSVSLKSKKEDLKRLIDNNNDNLAYYLIFLRLFPGSPNWMMNISFPHLNISQGLFTFTLFIGIAPWNFFSCSAGNFIRELTKTGDILDWNKYILILCLAFGFLIFPIVKNKVRNYFNQNKEKTI